MSTTSSNELVLDSNVKQLEEKSGVIFSNNKLDATPTEAALIAIDTQTATKASLPSIADATTASFFDFSIDVETTKVPDQAENILTTQGKAKLLLIDIPHDKSSTHHKLTINLVNPCLVRSTTIDDLQFNDFKL